MLIDHSNSWWTFDFTLLNFPQTCSIQLTRSKDWIYFLKKEVVTSLTNCELFLVKANQIHSSSYIAGVE